MALTHRASLLAVLAIAFAMVLKTLFHGLLVMQGRFLLVNTALELLVVVLGFGPIGYLFTALAKNVAAQVMCTEIDAFRLAAVGEDLLRETLHLASGFLLDRFERFFSCSDSLSGCGGRT